MSRTPKAKSAPKDSSAAYVSGEVGQTSQRNRREMTVVVIDLLAYLSMCCNQSGVG
jgi:hypothetical protein